MPVLTPEIEKELFSELERIRVEMLRAIMADEGASGALMRPLRLLAAGCRVEMELLLRSRWGVVNNRLPADRRGELTMLLDRLPESPPTAATARELSPCWAFVERTGRTAFEGSASEPAVRFGELSALHRSLMERMVEANIRLVVKWARMYGRLTPVDEMDLVQEGCEGLMSAVRKFDHSRGYKFSTYAVWWIRQAIIRALVRNGRLVRLPVHAASLQAEMRRMKSVMAQRSGRIPETEELAREIGVSPDVIKAISIATCEPLALDRTLGEDSDTTIHEIVSTDGSCPRSDAMRRDVRERLARAMESLEPRERQILESKFGLSGGDPMTLAEIGRTMGLSRERVRQLECRALCKLRSVGTLCPEDTEDA